MSYENPQKVIGGVCPNCGPSRISVLLESFAYYSGISTPNWSSNGWYGRCCNCHAYLETFFDDDDDVEKLEWSSMYEDNLEFLFSDSPPAKSDLQSDP